MYISILVKQVYWYISQVSGERLQDHWSSGFIKRPETAKNDNFTLYASLRRGTFASCDEVVTVKIYHIWTKLTLEIHHISSPRETV